MLTDAGVLRQALALAAEEMDAIDGDDARWGEHVWNAGAHAGGGGMVYVFGQGDRWVAEATRDRIMARESGAKTVLLREGLPHGFCIHDSVEMAGLCGEWLQQILGGAAGLESEAGREKVEVSELVAVAADLQAGKAGKAGKAEKAGKAGKAEKAGKAATTAEMPAAITSCS